MDENSQHPTKRERRELRRQERREAVSAEGSKRKIKRAVLWSLIILFIGGTVFAVIKLAANAPKTNNLILASAVSASDRTQGNKDSKIILVEYADFQCPACGIYYPLVKDINKEFGDKILFVYRNFPLSQIHQNADLAAHAAEAAGKQNKFWEMHDMIFDNQNVWSENRGARDIFIKYAENLKLDVEKFKGDIDSKEVASKVSNDYQSGIASGVNSTPTFFLQGKRLQNPSKYDEFRKIIDDAVKNTS